MTPLIAISFGEIKSIFICTKMLEYEKYHAYFKTSDFSQLA